MKTRHPDPLTTHLYIPIDGSRTEAGLGRALDALLRAAKTFPKSLNKNDHGDVPSFLIVTFHGDQRWLAERPFFERAAKFPALRPKIAEYIDRVSPKAWPKDPFHGAGFWTSAMAPAGSLAAVPLALADKTYIDAAIRHLRGADLGHETFQRSFIAELVKRHGICPETLRLIAFRAVDGAGQDGEWDLGYYASDALSGHLDDNTFAELVDAQSQRSAQTEYRSLYVSNAGKALFGSEPDRFAAWLAFFAKKGLAFKDAERVPPTEARKSRPPPPWKDTWEEAASCTDRD